MKNLRRTGIPFKVNIVVVRHNFRELAAMVQMLRAFFTPGQLSLIKIKYPIMSGRMLANPGQLVAVPELLRAVRRLEKGKSDIPLMINELPLCIFNGMEEYSHEACRRLESVMNTEFFYLNGATLTNKIIMTSQSETVSSYCRSCKVRALCIGPRHFRSCVLKNTLFPADIVRRIKKRIVLLHKAEDRRRRGGGSGNASC